VDFAIYSHIADLSAPNNGWVKELNLVSWGCREPVYDIRAWTEDHSRFGKGVTLTAGEMVRLKQALLEKQVF
jgi:hypothetical protein